MGFSTFQDLFYHSSRYSVTLGFPVRLKRSVDTWFCFQRVDAGILRGLGFLEICCSCLVRVDNILLSLAYAPRRRAGGSGTLTKVSVHELSYLHALLAGSTFSALRIP